MLHLKTKSLAVYFGLFVICSLTMDANECNAGSNIFADAQIEFMDDSDHILFVIRNQGNSTVEIDRYRLPWESPWSLHIVFYDLKNRKSHGPRYLSMPGFSSGKVTIAPGGSVKGNLAISPMLINYQQVRTEIDLIVFWSFFIEDAHPVGGFIFLPKRK